jgi:uncharacterized protein YacL
MLLWLLRGLFVFAGGATAYAIGRNIGTEMVPYFWLLGGLVVCIILVVVEWFLSKGPISLISSLLFGTLLGMLTGVLGKTVLLLVIGPVFEDLKKQSEFEGNITLALMIVFIYLGVSLLYRTRDRFRFLIPYVEFRREEKGARPVILDTSVIVDGRIADILKTHIIDGPIIVPQTVLQELHRVADSDDKLKRERGRLGLRALNEIRDNTSLDVRIQRVDIDDRQPVDEQLIEIAKKLNARIVTTDFNLNRLASLERIEVININELANALKPQALPDEQISIKLIKRGEQPGQAVGYLDDGTMVVVEEAMHMLGEQVNVVVTNTITRDTGRMIFGRLASAPSTTTTRVKRQK